MVMVRHYYGYKVTENTTVKKSDLYVKTYQEHFDSVIFNKLETVSLNLDISEHIDLLDKKLFLQIY